MKNLLIKKMFYQNLLSMFIILVFILTPKLSADEAAKKIKFFRASEPGNVLVCDIEAEAKSATVMTTQDGNRSEKSLCNNIKIQGIMTVKTVTEYGRPATIDFKVEKVKGAINGQDHKFLAENKELEINLESKPCEFRLKDRSAELSKEEILLLALVFRKTRKENMSDFIGTEKEIKVGDTWKTPTAPLEGEFEKRGIKLEELEIGGTVKLAERKEVHGYDCWIFNAGMNAKKGDEFEFDFKAEVSLPTDEKTGAVKVSRTASEKLLKKVTDKNNAIMPDLKELSLTVIDTMTAVTVPVAKGGK